MTYCDINDLRKAYSKQVPKMFRDYCESGSWSEQTLSENISDFSKLKFRQRVARNLENRSVATTICGQDVSMPIIGAPIGLLGMQYADGEIHAARAFEKFGVPFTLSTMSICSIEEVARKTQSPFWFQLYAQRDREFTSSLIERAKVVECSALVVTLDLQVLGKRHADIRNGMTAPPRLTLRNIIDISKHPKWALRMLLSKNRSFGNIQGHAEGIDGMGDLMKWTANQFDLSLNWDDLKRFRDQWQGSMILKGIMDVEDVKMAVKCGADAIVVSNHGGRQLDGAPSSISVLPEIVKAVGNQAEIIIDSGIRTGQDILRARALGAKAVMIGRAFVYGLGANGEKGVKRALEIFKEELDLSMAFCGHRKIEDVDITTLYQA